MVKAILRVGMVILVGFGMSYSANSQCVEMDSDYMKSLLGGAVYDNFQRTEIATAEDPYDIEFQVDLLKNFKYKLIFDMSAKSEGVIVKLYDLGKKAKKGNDKEPKLLYTSTEDKMDENAIFNVSFEAPRTRLLVKYEVKDATYEGCVTFMLGVFVREESASLDNKDQNN